MNISQDFGVSRKLIEFVRENITDSIEANTVAQNEATKAQVVYNGVGMTKAKAMALQALAELNPFETDITLAVALATGKSSYEFTLVQDVNQKKFENRIQQNDILYVSSVGFAVTKDIDAESGAVPLYSYPDPKLFGNAEFKALMSLYQTGTFSLDVNNSKILQNLPMSKFLEFTNKSFAGGDTTRDARFISNTTPAVSIVIPDGMQTDSGFYPVAQLPIISGRRTNKIRVDSSVFNGAVLSSATAGTTNYLLCKLRGVLVPNGSQPLALI